MLSEEMIKEMPYNERYFWLWFIAEWRGMTPDQVIQEHLAKKQKEKGL